MFFGLTLWLTFKHARRDTKLIEASGRPAVAEILTIGTVQWAEQEAVRLGLRISGQGSSRSRRPSNGSPSVTSR